MTEEDTFWLAMEANPECMTTRLVFCDWLAERSDPREMGIRALAANSKGPIYIKMSNGEWLYLIGNIHTTFASLDVYGRCMVPNDWISILSGNCKENRRFLWRYYTTYRDGVEDLADGFLRLPPERQAELLRGPHS